MKKIKNFFISEQTDKDKVFSTKTPIKALGDNRTSINDQEYDTNPIIQAYLTNTKITT